MTNFPTNPLRGWVSTWTRLQWPLAENDTFGVHLRRTVLWIEQQLTKFKYCNILPAYHFTFPFPAHFDRTYLDTVESVPLARKEEEQILFAMPSMPCSIPNCTGGRSAFRLPADPELSAKWMLAIKAFCKKAGTVWIEKNNPRFCEKHFNKSEVKSRKGSRRLTEGSVISIFPTNIKNVNMWVVYVLVRSLFILRDTGFFSSAKYKHASLLYVI